MGQKLTDIVNPKLEMRDHGKSGGYGVYTKSEIEKGEVLLVWGGDIVNYEELQKLPVDIQKRSLQVEEDAYQIPTRGLEIGDVINHSCDPNAGIRGQIVLVAMRRIKAGEEITYDYAMSDGSPYDEFECECDSENCRKYITGNDWSIKELQIKYAGYFSPYLQKRIEEVNKLKKE